MQKVSQGKEEGGLDILQKHVFNGFVPKPLQSLTFFVLFRILFMMHEIFPSWDCYIFNCQIFHKFSIGANSRSQWNQED